MSDSTQEASSNGRPKFNRKFVQILAWVITFVWALSMIGQAVLPGYHPPTSIHTLMMIVVATAFGTNFLK